MLSVIVSVFNEEENLPEFHRTLSATMEGLGEPWEVLYVDDGSIDGSRAFLSELARRDPGVVVVHLSRNFGHESAMQAGIDHAKGSRLVLMDADLQHPPSLVPEIGRRLAEGCDVVFCIRAQYPSSLWRRWGASLFYGGLRLFANTDLAAHSSDFFGISRRLADCLRKMPERGRFLRGLVAWSGYRRSLLHYEARQRHAGRSKYTFMKLLELSVDAVLSFSANPLRKFALLGLGVAFGGFLYGLFIVALFLFQYEVLIPGWATVVVSILFMGGLNLFIMSVLGEYLVRIHSEIKGRPLYLVDEVRRAERNWEGRKVLESVAR